MWNIFPFIFLSRLKGIKMGWQVVGVVAGEGVVADEGVVAGEGRRGLG